ncbi:signal peptidase I [Gordonia iterans]
MTTEPAQAPPGDALPGESGAPPSEPDSPKGALHYVWQGVSWILLIAAFAVLCATIVVPKAAGAQPYTVLTGSMRPDYPPGTLIVVKPRPVDQIQAGDVITYQLRSGEPGVVTHRVVEVTEAENGEPRFITKGDANNVLDEPPVRPVQIRGVLWYSIPYLGYVNTWFTGNRRTITVFVLAGILFAYAAWEFYMAYREDSGPDDEPPDESAEDAAALAAAGAPPLGTEPLGTTAPQPIVADAVAPTADDPLPPEVPSAKEDS